MLYCKIFAVSSIGVSRVPLPSVHPMGPYPINLISNNNNNNSISYCYNLWLSCQVSVEHADNMTWKKLAHVIYFCSPPASYLEVC